MSEPYRFSVYAADGVDRSVNFGLVATYRQKWELQNYQVGELLKTIPLAPKEVRKFTRKVAIRKSRAEKEVENNLQVRKSETAQTARAETEIIQKAQKKTNFQLGAEGSVSLSGLSAQRLPPHLPGMLRLILRRQKKSFGKLFLKLRKNISPSERLKSMSAPARRRASRNQAKSATRMTRFP